jgi:hypothetical protein
MKKQKADALSRGAALSKLPQQASVVATSATKHYGVEAWGDYDSVLDSDVPSEIRRDGSRRAQKVGIARHITLPKGLVRLTNGDH